MPPTPLSPETLTRLQTYLNDHGQSPEQYIIRVFATQDVVLLAEDHGIRHNLTMIHALIPLLYDAGVTNLGMEFGASEDQAALDQLVTGESYDEEIARRLMFHYNTGWALKEYHEVYRAAWAFNRTLDPSAPKFRVLNLSYVYNWDEAPIVRTPENAKRIYPHGPIDAYRAEVTRREVLDKGQKILILTGSVHAFTRYHFPVHDFNAENFVRFEGRNLGQLLYKQAPDRVYCILLHHPFSSKWLGGAELVYPAGGAIDQVMTAYENKRVGFDLRGTPFGEFPENSYYSTGYADFRLADLADGYIYDRPFAEFEGCTLDEAFVTDANWAEAQRQYPDPDWHPRPATISDYWEQVGAYLDIARRYRNLR